MRIVEVDMNTALERAKTLVNSLRLADKTDPSLQEAEALILLALKEQNRETRQACADAISKLPGETGDDLIDAGMAIAACLNVNAI